MKKLAGMLFALMVLVSVTFAQHDIHNSKIHGEMRHDSMSGLGRLVYKGEKSGISVGVYLNDIESAMKAMMKDSNFKIDKSKMDPNLTHHISLSTDGDVDSATLSLTYKDNTKNYTLMSMHGHFGADVSMKQKGTYNAKLTVITKKGKKITFSFTIKQ